MRTFARLCPRSWYLSRGNTVECMFPYPKPLTIGEQTYTYRSMLVWHHTLGLGLGWGIESSIFPGLLLPRISLV